jgi:hypothetical protein
MKRRTVLGAGLAALPLSACLPKRQVWTLRYRLRIRVRVRGREYEGSSVYRTDYARGSMLSQSQGYKYVSQAWGEAVVVDLGELGLIVGALALPSQGRSFSPKGGMSIVGPLQNRGLLGADRAPPTNELYERALGLKGEVDWLSPTLLHFDSTRTRESVNVLYEERPPKDESAEVPWFTFRDGLGAESSLSSVTLEMVDEEPTRQIERYLPWVTQMLAGVDSDGRQIGRSYARNLNAYNFVMWGDKG